MKVSDVTRLERNNDTAGLIDAWRSRPPASVRPALIDALSRQPDSAQGRGIVLEAARRDSDVAVRQRAVSRLEAYTGDDVDDVLIDALADPFPSVRGQAKATLERRLGRSFARVTAAARAHQSPLVRAALVRLLSSLGARQPSFRQPCVDALTDRARRDDDPTVRAAAATGLGALNAVSARALLTELSRTDDDPTVRLEAGRGLRKLDAPDLSERSVVMVLPLQNKTGLEELDPFGEQVADLLAAEIATAGVSDVLERAKRDAAIDELRRAGSLLYDGDRPNAPQIGRFALANQLVFGSIQRTGLIYTIIVNRMDVSTLKLVPGASVSVRGYRADLDRLKADAARKFVARFR